MDVITQVHHPNHYHNKIITDHTFPEFVEVKGTVFLQFALKKSIEFKMRQDHVAGCPFDIRKNRAVSLCFQIFFIIRLVHRLRRPLSCTGGSGKAKGQPKMNGSGKLRGLLGYPPVN